MNSCRLLWHIRRLGRKPAAGHRRNYKRRGQPRVRVAEPELAAMQCRDCRSQTQSETGTRQCAARFEPHKAFNRMLSVAFRNPRPAIGDAEQHVVALATCL